MCCKHSACACLPSKASWPQARLFNGGSSQSGCLCIKSSATLRTSCMAAAAMAVGLPCLIVKTQTERTGPSVIDEIFIPLRLTIGIIPR